jgi:methylase of polypeptide subunit release factors
MGVMDPFPDPDLASRLARDLAAADYTTDAVRSAWGEHGDEAIARGLVGPALRGLGERSDALAVLARLLGLGRAQPRAAVEAALPRTASDGLARLGLARIEGDEVVATALVRPQAFVDDGGEGEWLIASDLDEAALGGALPEGHVLGVGGASQTLARLQIPGGRGSEDSGLDLGTGCGIQALRLRRTVGRVVATDISPRALRFAELNALLNGVDGIETRHGSLFAPVAGERFDRIVSNPPFVITPRAEGVPSYEYRDAGREGDALVAEVVSGAGAHLRPGGIAQFLGNWEYRDDADGLDRVRTWVDASPDPVDAWVIERERLDPLAYAELWIRDGGTVAGTPEFARLVDAWLDDFAARGVTAIGFGYVVLRRPVVGGVTLRRFEAVGGSASVSGEHLAAALAAHDQLHALDDAGLAASRFVVAPDVTEARHHRPGDEAPTVIELRQGAGFGRSFSVDPALAALVGASDGELTVGALIDAIAELLEVDAGALRADVLPRVRELAFAGILTLAP